MGKQPQPGALRIFYASIFKAYFLDFLFYNSLLDRNYYLIS